MDLVKRIKADVKERHIHGKIKVNEYLDNIIPRPSQPLFEFIFDSACLAHAYSSGFCKKYSKLKK